MVWSAGELSSAADLAKSAKQDGSHSTSQGVYDKSFMSESAKQWVAWHIVHCSMMSSTLNTLQSRVCMTNGHLFAECILLHLESFEPSLVKKSICTVREYVKNYVEPFTIQLMELPHWETRITLLGVSPDTRWDWINHSEEPLCSRLALLAILLEYMRVWKIAFKGLNPHELQLKVWFLLCDTAVFNKRRSAEIRRKSPHVAKAFCLRSLAALLSAEQVCTEK